ncbi:MAG TPA: hypothetical protein VK993_04795 [Chthoniobacterales bacterium]|nr:hypothetical protein [Chthoniobacterales bacterium]
MTKHGASLSRSAEATQLVRIPFGFESAINDLIWTSSVEEAVRGVETPTADMSLLDAFYFVAEDDARNAVMYACWAVEQAVEAEFTRAWQNQRKARRFRRGALSGHDLTAHIARDAKRLFSRSFQDEFPRNYENVSLLWQARNIVAHGGSRGAYELIAGMKTEELERIVRSARVAVRWLRTL